MLVSILRSAPLTSAPLNPSAFVPQPQREIQLTHHHGWGRAAKKWRLRGGRRWEIRRNKGAGVRSVPIDCSAESKLNQNHAMATNLAKPTNFEYIVPEVR